MDDQRPGSVLSLEDSASFDELEGAAALPRETEVRAVEWFEDGGRQSETTAGFGTRSPHTGRYVGQDLNPEGDIQAEIKEINSMVRGATGSMNGGGK